MRVIKKFLGAYLYFLVFFAAKIIYLVSFPFKRYIHSARVIIDRAIWKARLGYLGGNTNIYPLVVIHDPGRVRIGSNVDIAEFIHIWGAGGVEIGDSTIIAAHVVITSLTHDTQAYPYRSTLIKKPVKIGEGVWIGSGAVIMPGVTIGDKAVVGAGSVVTHDVEPDTIVAGVPARLLRQIKRS